MTHDNLVEVQVCQLCGSEASRKVFQDGPFRLLRCDGCNLAYVSPRLTEGALLEVYGAEYWESDRPMHRGYACYAADEELYLKTFRRRSRLLDDHFVKNGQVNGNGQANGHKLKILDVGCAAGFFLRVMKEHGHDVYGVELSDDIAHHAMEHLGEQHVHVGTMTDLPDDKPGFERGSFDLVTLWDVVEHVPDPQQLLRQIHAMLKPSGMLVLETQNIDSRFAKLLGKRWQHFKHEEHLYHFDPDTVRELLGQSGFVVSRNTPSYGGKYVSLSFVAERARRLPFPLGYLAQPLRLLGKASFYLNLRDEMVIVARPVHEELSNT